MLKDARQTCWAILTWVLKNTSVIHSSAIMFFQNFKFPCMTINGKKLSIVIFLCNIQIQALQILLQIYVRHAVLEMAADLNTSNKVNLKTGNLHFSVTKVNLRRLMLKSKIRWNYKKLLLIVLRIWGGFLQQMLQIPLLPSPD